MTDHQPNTPEEGLEELDLMIHNMDTREAELGAQKALEALPGVRVARIVRGGVWLRYNPRGTTKELICDALHRAGYRAAVFQDSKTGVTGVSAQ